MHDSHKKNTYPGILEKIPRTKIQENVLKLFLEAGDINNLKNGLIIGKNSAYLNSVKPCPAFLTN